ncbi:MAG: hypothetical protein KGL39_17130 [Patescibacteria group bacterium]|nr:hypothetical protein [Patescibacteria group bacterium]
MSYSQYLDKKLQDYTFEGGAFTAPSMYLAVSTANPLADNSGNAEPSGNSYARVSISTGNWTATVLGTGNLVSSATFTFPQASGSWGTLTYFAIFDASSTGNQLCAGALSASKTIGANDTLSFASTNVTLTLT